MYSSLIGHHPLKNRLISMVENIGVAGTYLFFGPPSSGKRTFAFETARILLCEGEKKISCECRSCKFFKKDHPDFMALGQEKIKVDDINSLIEFTSLSPLLSDRKVIVIDNADNISGEAANQLLKTIEEPPDGFFFFLVSSKTEAILPTILSRCMKFKFDTLSQQDLINVLYKNMGFDLPKARVLAWVGAGSGVDIFSNANKYLNYRNQAMEFILSLRRKDLVDLLDFVDKLDRKEIGMFVDMVLLIITDMILLINGIEDIVNSEERSELTKFSKEFNVIALVTAASYFSQIKRNSYLNVNMVMVTKNAIFKAHPLLTAK